jgi:2-dehydropantoate 2-reductase
MKPWYLLGVGALGGLFAHRLADGGASVRLLTRQPTTVQKIVLEQCGQQVTRTFDCSWVTDESPIEQLVILTKSTQFEAALTQIASRMRPGAIAVALGNGLGLVEIGKRIAPTATWIAGSTTAGCRKDEGRWIASGAGLTQLGWTETSSAPSSVPDWSEAWFKGVPGFSWEDEMAPILVQKAAINAVINPLTAVHQINNGALREAPYREQFEKVTAEVSLLLRQLGYAELATSLPTRVLAVVEDTATNISSMAADVAHGRPTEHPFILGWFLQQAQLQNLRLEQVPHLVDLARRFER